MPLSFRHLNWMLFLLLTVLFLNSELSLAGSLDRWSRVGEFSEKAPRGGRNQIAYFNGKFWANLRDGFETSTDGRNWTKHKPFDMRIENVLVFRNKLWFQGYYYNSTEDTTCLQFQVTADGTHWTTCSAINSTGMYDDFNITTYAGFLWYLENETGAAWKSLDGIRWYKTATEAPWAPRYDYTATEFNGRLWLLFGGFPVEDQQYSDLNYTRECSDIWSTADGITWRRDGQLADELARSRHACVVYNHKLVVTGGETEYLWGNGWTGSCTNSTLVSTDGVHWTSCATPAWQDRMNHSMVVGGNRLYILGGKRLIPDTYDMLENLFDIWSTPDLNWDACTAESGLIYKIPRSTTETLRLKMKNIGLRSWSRADKVSLKLIDDPNHVWAGPTTIPVASRTIIKPKQTCTFSIPVCMAKLFSPATVKVQMFQDGFGYFGDVIALDLRYRPEVRMKWHKVDLPIEGIAVTQNGKMIVQNYCTGDGKHWTKLYDQKSMPFLNILYSFKSNIWATRLGQLLYSINGRIWTPAIQHGFPFDWSWSENACTIFKNRIFIVDEKWSWSSLDGVNWTSSTISGGRNNYLSFSGALAAFQNKLWFLGGGGEDSERVYCSSDGLNWQDAGPFPPRIYPSAVVYRNRLWCLAGDADVTGIEQGQCNVICSRDGIHWETSDPIPADYDLATNAVVFDDKIWFFNYSNSAWWGSLD